MFGFKAEDLTKMYMGSRPATPENLILSATLQRSFESLPYHLYAFNPDGTPKSWESHRSTTDYLANYLGVNGSYWIANSSSISLKTNYDFMRTLPYIIRIQGAKPINIVHADMPFDDKELMKRLESSASLTEIEIKHCCWARASIDTKIPMGSGRSPDSDLTVCGHQVLGGPRLDSNTVNLDVGTFERPCIAVLNHKTMLCTVLGKERITDTVKREHLQHFENQTNALLEKYRASPIVSEVKVSEAKVEVKENKSSSLSSLSISNSMSSASVYTSSNSLFPTAEPQINSTRTESPVLGKRRAGDFVLDAETTDPTKVKTPKN